MDDFKAEAIRLALVKMFKGGHFSICTVDDCLEAAGIHAPTAEMEALNVLHCVHWSDMTPEMRQEVTRRTLRLFSFPETDLSELETPVLGSKEGAASLFGRLLGRGAVEA